jgi:hypothetical protein
MADGALNPQVASAAETQCRRLRADAARNREAVLTAAREVFAEHGLGAPLEEIARRAGVGIGTLYRRFPRRWPSPTRGPGSPGSCGRSAPCRRATAAWPTCC